MSERILNTICAVIERHDHHCGDDVVRHTARSVLLLENNFERNSVENVVWWRK